MTTTDLAVRPGSGLDIGDTQEYWTDRQLAALRQIGVQDASPGDLTVFFHYAQRTGLDPFARQLYMIKRDGKQTIQTGIDGLRLVAHRAATRNGETIGYENTLWADEDGNWRDVWLSDKPPTAAKVTVTVDGSPFPAVALWREYVQTTKDGAVTKMWRERPAGQLAKCAEALSLRRAYPQDLSGLYTPDEMRDDRPAPQQQRRVTAQVITGETAPETAEPDPVTGEVGWPEVTQPPEPT